MKKSRQICLVLTVVVLFQLFIIPVAAQTPNVDTAISKGCHTIDGMVPVLGLNPIVENAQSVLLYERTTDTLMYAWNADAQIYPASLVKIMSAFLTIQKVNLTDVVTVSAQVLSTIPDGAASAELQENEVISVQDLLYCMMVGSANDAAAVLAQHVAGSQEAFVSEMNQLATELGCKDTVFTDPHGLSSDQHSTARDIGRILAAAMDNETFESIFCAAEYTVNATNKSQERKLETRNLLMDPDSALYYDARVTGGRTGTGLSGEQCIAATAQAEELQMISVVIGSQSVYKDDGYTVTTIGGFKETISLLDSSLTGFKPAQILYDGQALKQYRVTDGDADLIVAPKVSISTILPSDTDRAGLSYRYNDSANGFQAPVDKGQKVSTVEIWNGSICVGQADLYAMNRVSVQQTSIADETQSDRTGALPVILWVILGVMAVCVGIIFVLRFLSIARMRAAHRRSRRNRRNRRRAR